MSNRDHWQLAVNVLKTHATATLSCAGSSAASPGAAGAVQRAGPPARPSILASPARPLHSRAHLPTRTARGRRPRPFRPIRASLHQRAREFHPALRRRPWLRSREPGGSVHLLGCETVTQGHEVQPARTAGSVGRSVPGSILSASCCTVPGRAARAVPGADRTRSRGRESGGPCPRRGARMLRGVPTKRRKQGSRRDCGGSGWLEGPTCSGRQIGCSLALRS